MQASMIAWVVTYLLHSTILVLGAWLLERRWGDRPERMSAVWKTALVGGLLTATVQTGLGIAPMAGRWDLAPELSASSPSAGSPGASTGAAGVVAPVEAPVAVAGTPVLASVRSETAAPSWPPPDREAPAMTGLVAGEAAERVASPEPSWPPPDAAVVGEVVTERDRTEGTALATVEPVVGPAASPALAPVVERAPWHAMALVVERAPWLAMAAAREHATGSSSATSPSSSAWVAVVPWILAVVGLGAVLGLASVAVAFAALRRQLEGRRTLTDGTLSSLLEGLRRRAGIARPVRLTVAPRVQVPMAVGVLRPEIVVPIKAAQGLPLAHQESLLAHELAHVLRHDPAWRLVGLLVERVFFFQPLNRLASRRVAQSAEYLCDDWAARHTRQPLALASCLTEIATWVARTGPVPATMAGPRSILGRRVQRLLQPGRASARPWWLSVALGLPLLAVVAVAPGVGAHAKGDRKRADRSPEGAERIVVIDAEGRRHEVRPSEHGAIVVHQRDGELVVRTLDDGAAAPVAAEDGGSRRDARKASREQERARDRARRQARKELRRAFRAAKARGDAAPSRAEVEAILRRARVAEGSRHEHVEVHVVVPGELELHGRVPVDVEAIEDGIAEGVEDAIEELERLDLEGLRALEGLEGLEGLEDLGPLLEEIEEELEAEGLDVVIRRRPGAAAPEMRIRLSPEHERALREAARMQAEAQRAHEAAVREQLRHRQSHARDVEREAARLEREAEALRRAIEAAERDGLPSVWVPAPEAPLALGTPMPAPAPPLAGTPMPAPAPRPMLRRRQLPTPPTPPAAPMVRRQGYERGAPVPVLRRHPVPAPAPMPPAAPGAATEPPPAPPAPPRVRRIRVPAPTAPGAPVAPMPPTAPAAPTAPQPDAGPLVWVSWTSPTHG